MKAEVLNQLIELADGHQKADEYLAGHYEWKGGACAIGCTIRDAKAIGIVPKSVMNGDHAALAAATSVPEMVWRLCDHIFEGLEPQNRPAWPPRFLRAIRPDADYASLPARIMARCAHKLAEDAIDPKVKAISLVNADLWERRARGQEPTEAEWDAARRQAWHQADAAIQEADAAKQQADAAIQQADAAWHQAGAAIQQADAAWHQANAARQQTRAARRQFWLWCADMVCEELQWN